MKDEIKLLEQKIENTLLKLSLYSEFNQIFKALENNYLKIKKDVFSINDDFKIKEYYASLLSFNEIYISYTLNLIANKKENKSIYDTTDSKIDEDIISKEKELKTLINYLKEKFPMIGNILEQRLIKLKKEYVNNLEDGLEKNKNDSDLYLGVTKETKLSFGTIDMIKRSYLSKLEIFDELFLNKVKKMIDKNLQITKQYELLFQELNGYKEDKDFVSLVSKLDLLLKEYGNKCEYIIDTVHFDDINNEIESIQNDYINRLKQFEKNMNKLVIEKEKEKHYQELVNYLDNIDLNNIKHEKISELESYLSSNNLPMTDFYSKLYSIIEYELVNYMVLV